MEELARSYDHLRQAASHAASGTAERLSPAYDRAREVAEKRWESFSPMYAQLRDRAYPTRSGTVDRAGRKGRAAARHSRQLAKEHLRELRRAGDHRHGHAAGPSTSHRRRWIIIGLLTAGAAAGAAGAMMARRRRAAAEWDEYEPLAGLEMAYGMEAGQPSTRKKVADGAASVADTVSQHAGKLADSLHGRADRPGGDSPDLYNDRAGDNGAVRGSDRSQDKGRGSSDLD